MRPAGRADEAVEVATTVTVHRFDRPGTAPPAAPAKFTSADGETIIGHLPATTVSQRELDEQAANRRAAHPGPAPKPPPDPPAPYRAHLGRLLDERAAVAADLDRHVAEVSQSATRAERDDRRALLARLVVLDDRARTMARVFAERHYSTAMHRTISADEFGALIVLGDSRRATFTERAQAWRAVRSTEAADVAPAAARRTRLEACMSALADLDTGRRPGDNDHKSRISAAERDLQAAAAEIVDSGDHLIRPERSAIAALADAATTSTALRRAITRWQSAHHDEQP